MSAEKGKGRKKYSILEAGSLVGVLSTVFVAKTLNGFHKWDFVSLPNLHGLLSLKKKKPLIFTDFCPAWDLFKNNAYPAAAGNIFLNTTIFYLFQSYFKKNLTEIPAVLLGITQRSLFHLFTGEKLTGLTHLEMMWKCKTDFRFFFF